MIKAEIITIGDEILYGQITDTNTQWISAELDKIGIKTVRKSSVGDTEEAILEIFEESSKRADLVIVTGGLGPTKDDITKKTLFMYRQK
jgi:nicotinamide-nucleotide amidase